MEEITSKKKLKSVETEAVLSGYPDIPILAGLDLLFIWLFSELCHTVQSEGKCCLLDAWCSSGLGLLAEAWHQYGPVCGTEVLCCLTRDSAIAESDPSLPYNGCLQKSKSGVKMRTFPKLKHLQWNVRTKA